MFWPTLREDELNLPSSIQRFPLRVSFVFGCCNLSSMKRSSMTSYEKEYMAIKASRKLCWFPALGTVEVELEGPQGERTFSVSPLQASVIALFQDQGSLNSRSCYCSQVQSTVLCILVTEIWTSDELANKLGVSGEMVRKGAGYWVANGTLRATFQGCTLVYEVSSGEDGNPTGEGRSIGELRKLRALILKLTARSGACFRRSCRR